MIVYGIEGKQDDVDPNVFDRPFYFGNDKMTFVTDVDMNNNNIVGLLEGTDDNNAVNFKQLNVAKMSITELHKKKTIFLERLIAKRALNESLFKLIFEFYAYLMDSGEFGRNGSKVTAFSDLKVVTSNGSPSSKPL